MTYSAPPAAGTSFDLRRYLEDVADYYHRGTPGRIHPRHYDHGVMPLWEFPEDHLEHILDLALSHRKPPRHFGEPGVFQMESRAWHEWHWVRGRKLRRDPAYAPRHRRRIPDSVRLAVYERDGLACLHCGVTENLSLDHIHPFSLGGLDTVENLQTLCRSCNSRKGAKV